MHRRKFLHSGLAATATLAPFPALAQEKAAARRTLLIATGASSGTFGAVGQSVCNFINAENRKDFACRSRSTAGSSTNVAALARRIDELGLAQTDTVWSAVNGKREWDGKPVGQLRAILPLYFEPITLVVRQEARIRTMADIKGKRLNLGVPGSDTRANAIDILSWYGLQADRDVAAQALELPQVVNKMVTREIDGFFFVGAHPQESITRISLSVPVALVPIDGPQIEAALRQQPHYATGTVPARVYRGILEPVRTVGTRAMLMTHDGLPADIGYELTKLLVDKWEALRAGNGALQPFQPADVVRQTAAPYHPGALRYLKERKFM